MEAAMIAGLLIFGGLGLGLAQKLEVGMGWAWGITFIFAAFGAGFAYFLTRNV